VHSGNSGNSKESHIIPYCERYILDALEACRIPEKLIHFLESFEEMPVLRVHNCVLAQIRDFRERTNVSTNANTVCNIFGCKVRF